MFGRGGGASAPSLSSDTMIGMSRGMWSMIDQSGSFGTGMTTTTRRVSVELDEAVVGAAATVISGDLPRDQGGLTGVSIGGFDWLDQVDETDEVPETCQEVFGQRIAPGTHRVQSLDLEVKVSHDLRARPH